MNIFSITAWVFIIFGVMFSNVLMLKIAVISSLLGVLVVISYI